MNADASRTMTMTHRRYARPIASAHAPSLALAVACGDMPVRLYGSFWDDRALEFQPDIPGDALACLEQGNSIEFLARGVSSPLDSTWKRYRARIASQQACVNTCAGGLVHLEDITRVEEPSHLEEAVLCRDIDVLLFSPFLSILTVEELPVFFSMLVRQRYAPGEALITQGMSGESLYIIQSGVCKVLVEKDGIAFEEARVGPGEVVGEMAVLTGGTRSASVVAEDTVVAWELQAGQYEALTATAPQLRQFLTELLQHRLENALHHADRVVGRYRIQRKLGQGGYALVYAGVHDILGLPVAIKMLKHTLAMDPEFVATFRREAQVIAKLNHPNVVRVYDIEELYRTMFIIMERLEGRSLKEELRRQGRLKASQTASILDQICQGLEYAHSQGILHRDIKPANIFLPLFGPLKILDFGLACTTSGDEQCFEGTAAYMAPEQIRGEALDLRTDLYALGCTAYELLVGRLPFAAKEILQVEAMHLNEPFPDPASLVPGLPDELRQFILTCTAKDPADRFASAAAAREHLQHLQDDIACPVATETRRLLTLHCFHGESQRQQLEQLVQEFTQRAQAIGVTLRASDFTDV